GGTVTVDANTTLTYDPVTRLFTATHRYLDDNPTATHQDNYTITVTTTDDDTDVGSTNATVTVVNAAASIAGLALDHTTIDEDGVVTLTGRVVDTGTLDTHVLVTDWGDGRAHSAIGNAGTNSTLTYDPATRLFTATHRYLDD